MSKQMDYPLPLYADGILTIEMEPPVAVGGWTVRYFETRRFGNQSGLIEKWGGSGFNNVSGVTVVNSGAGIFQIAINSVDTSGRCPGNYAFKFERMDSGSRNPLVEGYHIANY